MPVVQGAVEWASVQTPNSTFTPAWEVTVILSEDAAKQLKKEGIPVKKDDKGRLTVKFKRKVKRNDGSDNSPPRVIDRNNQPLSSLIGNGSICAVQYFPVEWKYAGKTGIKGALMGIKVLKLVEFARDELADVGDEDFDEEDSQFNPDELDEDTPFDDD